MPWNRWQDSPGIGGSFGVEYAHDSREHVVMDKFFRGPLEKVEGIEEAAV